MRSQREIDTSMPAWELAAHALMWTAFVAAMFLVLAAKVGVMPWDLS